MRSYGQEMRYSEKYDWFNKYRRWWERENVKVILRFSAQKYFDSCGKMNFVRDGYYKLNRRLLLLVGLWPYENSIYKYCQMILCNILIIFTMICQVRILCKFSHEKNLLYIKYHLSHLFIVCYTWKIIIPLIRPTNTKIICLKN